MAPNHPSFDQHFGQPRMSNGHCAEAVSHNAHTTPIELVARLIKPVTPSPHSSRAVTVTMV